MRQIVAYPPQERPENSTALNLWVNWLLFFCQRGFLYRRLRLESGHIRSGERRLPGIYRGAAAKPQIKHKGKDMSAPTKLKYQTFAVRRAALAAFGAAALGTCLPMTAVQWWQPVAERTSRERHRHSASQPAQRA